MCAMGASVHANAMRCCSLLLLRAAAAAVMCRFGKDCIGALCLFACAALLPQVRGGWRHAAAGGYQDRS